MKISEPLAGVPARTLHDLDQSGSAVSSHQITCDCLGFGLRSSVVRQVQARTLVVASTDCQRRHGFQSRHPDLWRISSVGAVTARTKPATASGCRPAATARPSDRWNKASMAVVLRTEPVIVLFGVLTGWRFQVEPACDGDTKNAPSDVAADQHRLCRLGACFPGATCPCRCVEFGKDRKQACGRVYLRAVPGVRPSKIGRFFDTPRTFGRHKRQTADVQSWMTITWLPSPGRCAAFAMIALISPKPAS